ncbi:MAG TPA: GSU2403 family nucleotidyltransferase fold protein [Caulobacteraceae bacterium]|jgi:hypothetical protein
MATVAPFTDEQARALVNLEQRYQVWMEAEQTLFALPYDLRRKEVSGRSYLYEIYDRSGNGKSLGPWSAEQEASFAEYHTLKRSAKARRDASRVRVDESGKLCRALRTPMLADLAGAILREADRRRLLGTRLLVVGTNALSAYALEAGGFIREAPDETQDFDLAWASAEPVAEEQAIWPMLKAVDPTFTVNLERTFQARSARAHEIELVVAPSRAGSVARLDQPKPILLPEQEWLLLGRPVDRVVICRDSSAARIVAPDPRWFALQKLWLAQKPSRDSLKRPKDRKQGLALLGAVREEMPQYPLDAAFEAELPDELAPLYHDWKRRT